MARRKWGSGSLYQRKDGRWVYQIEKDGKRTYAYGATPDEARMRAGKGPRPKRVMHGPFPAPSILWPRDRRGDQALAAERRRFATQVAEAVIRVGREEVWTAEYTAKVLIAQLAAGRIRRGVTGPCAYCGRWDANTIDHVVPTVAGGSDTPENIVSACHSCNSRKADRTPEQWGISA